MIGLLRLIGVFNAAIWLGGAVFFTAVASPALNSGAVVTILQVRNSPYYSPAIGHVVLSGYFQFSIVCALVALLHLTIEWIYLGRPASRKFPLGLLAGLLIYAMAGSNLLLPHMKTLHLTRFSAQAKAVDRVAAGKSYERWRTFTEVMNLMVVGGLVIYLWRITNPADTPRFISSVKFRG
ncbi:MAG TPA: hypothetical protein VK327_16090 [Candidatus Paceibacterota bacterium]|nr:hypothetical protein [Candidatus Paceibacterota bacterium]